MIIPAENGKPLPGINTFYSSSDIRNIKDFMNDIALNKSYQLELPSAMIGFWVLYFKIKNKVMLLKKIGLECKIMLQDEFNTALLFLTI